MKKTLILGTNRNTGSKEIIDASRNLGVSTVFTDYYDPQDSPLKHYADEYWNISIADIDALEHKCREEGVTGVYGGTDYAQDVALELCERLGLPSYCDKESWHYSRDKVAFKAMCRKHGVPVAEDAVVSAGDETASSPIGYPVVVKPSDRSGSVGMSRCHSDADYAPAVEKALTKSENGQILIERMLPGAEYHSLYIMRDGEPVLLCLNSVLVRAGTSGSFAVVSSTVVESYVLNKYLKEINPRIVEMLSDMGCRDGFLSVQLMSDEQGDLYAIEMGHRLIGTMLWMSLKSLTGFDTAQWMAHYAAFGNNDDLTMPVSQLAPFEACACSYSLWVKKSSIITGVYGLDHIQDEIQAIVHNAIGIGESLNSDVQPVIIVFPAADCDEMCRKIRFVNEHISVVDVMGEDILTRFDDFETLRSMCGTLQL